MFEQMFNISAQTCATLPLSLETGTYNLDTFLSVSLFLCVTLIFSLCMSYGGNIAHSRHANAKTTTRQCTPLLSPLLCQYGGASLTSRRNFFTKIDNPAPTSRVPAVASAAIFSLVSTLM
jgi:hypothetical protein